MDQYGKYSLLVRHIVPQATLLVEVRIRYTPIRIVVLQTACHCKKGKNFGKL